MPAALSLVPALAPAPTKAKPVVSPVAGGAFRVSFGSHSALVSRGERNHSTFAWTFQTDCGTWTQQTTEAGALAALLNHWSAFDEAVVFVEGLMVNPPEGSTKKSRKAVETAAGQLARGEGLQGGDTRFEPTLRFLMIPGVAIFMAGQSTHKPTTAPLAMRIGDTAEYDSYNLHYFGTIESIGAKRILVRDRSGHGHSMALETFAWRNRYGIERAVKSNSEWMD